MTNEQLAKLYYYMLNQMDSNTDFTNFRYLVEQNALNMNKLAYSIGPLERTGEKSCYLTDNQWESVIDAFDQVGIKRSYSYSLTSDATLKVYDINNKPYSKYHMTITRANDRQKTDSDTISSTVQCVYSP